MKTSIGSPIVKIPEGSSSPPSVETEIASATLGMEIRLRPFQELAQNNWDWNAKGVLQSNIERTGLFLASLNDGLDAEKEYQERYLCMRFIQNQPGDPLKMVALLRTVADSKSIGNVIENCWREVQSVHHYDYTFSLIPSEEIPEKTGQSWLIDRTKPVSVSVLHPTIGFLYESRKDLNISLPIIGKWSPTPTSLENAWRVLNHYPSPIMMDVLLKATYLRPDELLAYDKLLDELKLVVDGSNSVTNQVQAGQWLDMMKSRMSKFASMYMMQVRLASSGDMLSYLPRAIGTALTYQSALDQSLPFQGFQVVSYRGKDAHDWALRIAQLEFIDLDVSLPPQLTNFPFYATTAEALSVSRFVFCPKGGIPDLLLE